MIITSQNGANGETNSLPADIRMMSLVERYKRRNGVNTFHFTLEKLEKINPHGVPKFSPMRINSKNLHRLLWQSRSVNSIISITSSKSTSKKPPNQTNRNIQNIIHT